MEAKPLGGDKRLSAVVTSKGRILYMAGHVSLEEISSNLQSLAHSDLVV